MVVGNGKRWIIEVREIIDYYNCARDPKPVLLLICMYRCDSRCGGGYFVLVTGRLLLVW